MPLPRLLAAEKSIPFANEWVKPEASDGYARFLVPLEVEGVLETSVTLSVGAYIRRPDRHVTFELSVRGVSGQRQIRIERVDWRDIRGGHSNQRSCRGLWSGRRVPASHAHTFNLNWVEAERRMRKGKLPCAEPLEPEPQSFEELRTLVGRRLNINNIDVVPRPPWEYDLFT